MHASTATIWFAVLTKPNLEKSAKLALEMRDMRDLEVFLPLYRAKHHWSDRVKELQLPLFPRYVFCRFDPQCRTAVLRTPGVLSIIGFGNGPEPISDEEIRVVQRTVASGVASRPWPYIAAGDRVRIERGALEGIEGFVVRRKNDIRVVISITLLQRSVAIEIDGDSLRPIRERQNQSTSGAPEPSGRSRSELGLVIQ